MQDVLLKVYRALCDSAAVTDKIKGIYNNPRAPDEDIFPRLTMFEMQSLDSGYADDEAKLQAVDIRIDIWSDRNNLFELSAAVKTAIESAFIMRRVELLSDMYESDTNIYHKPINVKIMTEV